VIVDSSDWIEFFTDGPLAGDYAKYLKAFDKITTPTIVVYEVYKIIKRERTEEDALSAIAVMNRTFVVSLTESIALFAADLSLKHTLPMAASIVYATALEQRCSVVTSDMYFKDLKQVILLAKR